MPISQIMPNVHWIPAIFPYDVTALNNKRLDYKI